MISEYANSNEIPVVFILLYPAGLCISFVMINIMLLLRDYKYLQC